MVITADFYVLLHRIYMFRTTTFGTVLAQKRFAYKSAFFDHLDLK